MSSSDNPQFDAQLDPQPPVSVEPAPPIAAAGDPFVSGSHPPILVAPPIVRDPVWSGWDVLLIALLTIVTLIMVQFITVVGAQLLVYRHASFGDVLQKPILAILSQFVAYIIVGTFMVRLVRGKYNQPFWKAIRWNWPRNVALMLFVGMLTVGLDILSRFLPMPKSTPFDQFFARPSDAYLMVAFAVTFGPLMEEIFFRGFLYPVLERWMPAPFAIVLTALPFGMIHYLQYKSWAAVLVIGLVGVVLTTVRAVTKSVGASFLAHVGYNGTLMTMAALATDGFRHMERAALLTF